MRILLISALDDAGFMLPLPLGPACVAAATEQAGYETKLLTLFPGTDWEAQIRREIEQLSPDMIGLSVRNIDDQNMQQPRFLLSNLKQVVTTCRSLSPAPIVLGGAGFSIFPESVLAYLGADMGIRGDGEVFFPALLGWLEQGKEGPAPPSAYFAQGRHTAVQFPPDVRALTLPEPRFWLDFPGSGAMRIPVQTRRGCPMACSYCSTSAIQGSVVRKRDLTRVMSWLSLLRERGFRNFYFVDNTFNVPPSYAKDLCRAIIEAKLDIDWWAIMYPNWVDAELVELMCKAGCTQVSLGFESGAETVLSQFNKRFTPQQVRTVARLFADAGIARFGFLLMGGPSETQKTAEQSLDFADSLNLDSLKITVGIRIYPHTPLAVTALARGLIRPDDDLLSPSFYLEPTLRDWLPERIARRGSA